MIRALILTMALGLTAKLGEQLANHGALLLVAHRSASCRNESSHEAAQERMFGRNSGADILRDDEWGRHESTRV